jgi:hypothetical protein
MVAVVFVVSVVEAAVLIGAAVVAVVVAGGLVISAAVELGASKHKILLVIS